MLEVRNISAAFGTFRLNDVSFTARADDYTVLLGPCGAGKTKLLEIISGVAAHTGGRIFVDENDITALAPEQRRIGLIYQSGYLFPHLSVQANVSYGLRYLPLSRSEKEQRMKWIVKLLNMRHLIRRPSIINLSGGEQQIVILARTLVLKPSLLLMDEPFTSLDFSSREELFSIFKILQWEHGMTIFHVTHDREEASVLSDRVLFLWNGRLLQQSSFQELVSAPKSLEVVRFLGLKSILSGEVKDQRFTVKGCAGPVDFSVPGRPDGPGHVYIPAKAVTLKPALASARKPAKNKIRAAGRIRLLLERDRRIIAEIDLGSQTMGASLTRKQADAFRVGDQVVCRAMLNRVVFLEESS